MKQKSNRLFKIRTLSAAALLAGAGVFSLAADATGDATLNRLEVKVDGKNILPQFNPQTKTYELELGEEAASLATFSAAPASKEATVAISVNGSAYTNHSLGSLQGGENVITYTVKNGSATETYTIKVKTPEVVRSEYFTWKNANIYFVLTDRFYNGDTSNDNSYHRKRFQGEADVATFHGGDIKGLTQKLDYLDKLGVNAIWITAPYEQMHGWTGGKNDAFPHYAFHGYYALDWTFMDRNMGTIEDMRNFVTEAHKRGIRVVMDIVLNHTGYCTLDDAVDYDFGNFNGTPQAGWVPSGQYTMWSKSNSVSFNANEQGKWGNWWGPWVRAFGDRNWASNAGFAPEGGDDYTKPLAGLPDVVTDRTSSVAIPAFLKKKWAAENGGDYANYRLPNLEGWRSDNKGAPADYIINWLAGWVEYFGIDGFRCDTAKHLEKSRWNQLKQACKTALAAWRSSDRADQYAKDWDEDFWMTGEAFGWDHGDIGYFTEGGFDSMINFAFNGTEGSQGRTPSTEDWKYYSNYCNGSNGRQVLNYVSSHDTGLHRPGDQKKVATMLLLCPGGAQIYYGDETSRPYMSESCGGDASMKTRSDFNWNAVDNDDNKHWQKIGQFRRRNPAVGAGVQTELGSDTYGRKFSENGFENAVVIRLNTQAGQSYTVNVSGIFADGKKVMDGYDTSKTATVSGGKVTMTASGPVLLIEEYGTIGNNPTPPIPPVPSKPVVSASPVSGTTFTDKVTVTLTSNPSAEIHYTTDGSTPSAASALYTSPLTFTQTTTLKTFASNESGSDIKTFTYTLQQGGEDEAACYIYFDGMDKSDVAVWAWTDGDVNCTASGTWPGDKMTKKNGKYYWELPAGKQTPKNVIISWGSHNDGDKAGGGDLPFVNKHTYKADGSHSLVSYGPQKPVIEVSPDGGKVRGAATITVNIANEATSITGTFNSKSVSLSNGSNTIKVSDYLQENQSASFSVTATNSLGTTTWSNTFTRDDSQPVYTLTGDWRELSIYQIMVASFQHGEGGASGYSDMWGPEGHRKNGNLRGIINSLDYIKELGMNAIWMTPIFDSSNGQGGEKLQATGYFCTNYFNIDPKFGTMQEFEELVQKAHEKGIYIILDGVFGHHGGVNSSSPNGKRIDNGSGANANVRGSDAGNIAFPGSLDYFKEVVRFWMEKGVDGWRLDQCYQVYQGGHNYWKDLREEVERVASERKSRGEQWGTLGYMVGEDWTSAGSITVTQQDGLKSVMDFDGKDNLVNLGYGVGSIGWFLASDAATRGYKDSGVNPTIFLSNHDTARVGDVVDVNSKPEELMTRHAAVAAYSGPTCTYYGDEIGDRSGNGNPDNKARTSGRLSNFNQNEQKVHDYVAKVFKARAQNPALWRGTVSRQQGNKYEMIIKTDNQTGNKVVVIFSEIDTNVSIGGSGTDLINGGNVSGSVNVKAWEPAFIKMN